MLAGGRGRRLGVSKACLPLAARPMLHWPLAALRAALGCVAVAAKPDTELPALPAGVSQWPEPPLPRHPLTGIAHALRRAGGSAVVVCAVDLPMVDRDTVRALALTPAQGAPAVVARAGGAWQPLLARYEPAALPLLAAAADNARTAEVVRALGPRWVDVPPLALLNVNDRAAARRAERLLAARGGGDQPNVNA